MRHLPIYKKALVIFGLVLVAISAVFPVFYRIRAASELSLNNERFLEERKLDYHVLMAELQGQAAKFKGDAGILVKDISTGESISMNSSKLFPSASLVKLPIMAAVYQAELEGRLQLTDKLVLKRSHKVRDCSKLYFKRNGTKYEINDLIVRMITESDNTASNMLVEALGFGYINQKFVEFGLKDTDLRRGIMDLKWRRAGIENYTTVEDMAYLLEKIYNRELVSTAASDRMMAVLKKQKVNDRIPRKLPDETIVAHKTGSLRDTISDCGIVFTQKGDFIVCVITADIKNYRTAKRFIADIAACAYDKCYNKKTEMPAL